MTPIGLQSIVFIFINMFITNNAFRSPISDLLADPSETYWQATELALHHPWFLVTFRQLDLSDHEPFEIGRTVLLSNVGEMEQLINQDSGGRLVFDSIQVITPGHINGSDQWKMEPLHAAWSAQEPNVEGQTLEVYETIAGVRYVNSILGTSIDDLQMETLIARFPTNLSQ